ncbi:hypothetical protein [Legionella fallonii]|uniref:Uncharacterized protein n=1 Tax=Legionella fallonii LLAP-10 TaxID=1212491 RepID=A0A098G2T7_9GAMM|nr:hypothetical protein [Legionella fallonii]CEG56768.1 protein of unknown function [Legionella fallonii LLAP-10]
MKKLLLIIITLVYVTSAPADINKCLSKIRGYKVVKSTVYSFTVDKEKACFFAFYITNPAPGTDVHGDGNTGDSLWYGYYKMNNPDKIYEFPKPKNNLWSSICTIHAVSFYPMHGGKKRDVTIIGACDKQNAVNYTFPLVFIWQGDKYVLDDDVYKALYGAIALTVADVREYIKFPMTQYKVLRDRYEVKR